MKILVIDHTALNLHFCVEAQRAGHEVRLHAPLILKGDTNNIGRGLVHRMREWEPSMRWADLIVISDNSHGMHALEGYRKRGYPIFGATKEVTTWELNRQRGQDVFAEHGIAVAESHPFKNFRDAAAFASASDKRFVVKPNGDVAKALSYVPKGQEDLLYMLDRWQRDRNAVPDIVLQEFIEGTEFAVGGFMGRQGWVGPWLENFEHKKLMAGDSGPNTGEMGTVMRYVNDSKLAAEVLKPLEPELLRQGYVGYIDVAVIVDKRGRPWPLEFTCRFGYPLWAIQQCLHPDKAEWMLAAVRGENKFKPLYDVAVGVAVAMPDFPYDRRPRDEATGYPIFGLEKQEGWVAHDGVMLGEVMGKPMTVTASTTPITVLGRAATVAEAVEDAYTRVKKVHIPNSALYRDDIGRKVKTKLQTLKGFGYATEWKHG